MSNNDVVRLSMIGQIVRRRWRLLVVLAAVGALLGVGASQLFSPGYQSTSKVLVHGSQGNVDLQTEAQIATSSVVLDRTAAALGSGVTGTELQKSVTAGVVGGNVIEIQGTDKSAERAQQLTNEAARQYITFSTQLKNNAQAASDQELQKQQATLQQQIADANSRIAVLQGVKGTAAKAELDHLRTALAAATAALDDLNGRAQKADAAAAVNQTSVVLLEPAVLPAGAASPTLVQLVAGGGLLFVLLGVFAHLIAASADRRLRSSSEIAAALGSPVMGNVDVPEGPHDRERRRRLAWMWRLVRDDQPWDEPELPISRNDLDRDVLYRRVLARLRGAPGRIMARLRGTPDTVLRLLVVVADDDDAALRAVARLAVVAGADGEPTSVVTDSTDFVRMIQAAAATAGTKNLRLTVRSSSDPAPGTHRTVLRLVDVTAARPMIPDCGLMSGTLVVLTAGTRTAWELNAMAEACADAGHQVLGALVAHRIRSVDDRPVEPTQDSSKVAFIGKKIAGSA